MLHHTYTNSLGLTLPNSLHGSIRLTRAMPRESGRLRETAASRRDLRTDNRSEKRERSRSGDRLDERNKRTRTGSNHVSTERSRSSKPKEIDPSSVDPDSPEELAKFLGFSSFESTKGKKVKGNSEGAADVKKKRREYTQMLHRRKLYEIPLTKQQLAEKEAAVQTAMQS